MAREDSNQPGPGVKPGRPNPIRRRDARQAFGKMHVVFRKDCGGVRDRGPI